MIDISSFFRDKSLDPEKLRDFGFSVFAEGGFVKDYPILQKKYLLKVYVTNEGQVDFRVFDSENGEEYLPAHVFNATGSLVGEIHHECEVILCEISQHCFVTEIFNGNNQKESSVTSGINTKRNQSFYGAVFLNVQCYGYPVRSHGSL